MVECSCGHPPLVQTPPPDYVPGAWFDQAAVDRVVQALAGFRHSKGRRWAGRPLLLEGFQLEHMVAPIFGWKHPDGTRIVRTAWIELSRKNGKTTIGSGLGMVLTVADGELGAEVYSAAAAKSQARQCFDPAKEMARSCVPLRGKLRILKDVIEVPRTGSIFRVISSKGDLAHSLNVSGAIVDEVHVHKTRDLIDALETGTGAREQPLVIFITTADEGDEHSIYAEKHEYTRKVASRVVVDPSHFGVIYAAEPDDDPFDEATWEKANPGLGVTVSRGYLRKEAEKAKATPAYFPVFCRLHLGLRARAVTRAFDMGRWDAGGQLIRSDEWQGVKAYGGLDLSSVSDLTAFALVSDSARGVIVDPMFWVPEDRVDQLEIQCQVPLRQWAAAGFLKLTEGDVVDYAKVRKDILTRARELGVVLAQVAYDPYNAAETVQELEKAGVTMVPVRQGFLSLSPPMKELMRLVGGSKPEAPLVRHGGHPVLRWCVESTDAATDPGENVKPVKPDRRKSAKRIDGTAAVVNALSRLILERNVEEPEPAIPVRVR